MRVLLAAYGSRGDVEPMRGIGAELRAPGAEVSAALETALAPATHARAAAVADTVRTGGATAAAKLLDDTLGRERPPVSAPHPALGERV